MSKKSKPEIEIKQGDEALEAFEALMHRLATGESDLVGVDVYGLDDIADEDEYLPDDVMMVVYHNTMNEHPYFDARPSKRWAYLTADQVQKMAEELVRAAAELFDGAEARRDREAKQ